ncbi:MAG: N-acetylmuramoyl-L-alanine amidase [Acidobacteriota bacterium]|nr:N-acetylmuramoyl-L-alanine amidase [Acidobacteriota bacterium]MDE3162733.1 N-acetylmuramoyl-L-alanine amidase [Acidobacteriota bacterium]
MRWINWALAWMAPAALPLAAQAPQPVQSSRFVAVLDAAHGGQDSGGKIASGQMEKAVTLAMSVRLRSLLGARGMAVVTTRESDQALPPDRRAEIPNHAHAQACLILHATESGSGIHLFVSSIAPSQIALFLPWKTAQSAWVTRSLSLAGTLNAALLHAELPVTIERTFLPGLDSLACPAVAIEVAPNRAKDGSVTAEPDDAAYQGKVASAIAAGMLAFRSEKSEP